MRIRSRRRGTERRQSLNPGLGSLAQPSRRSSISVMVPFVLAKSMTEVSGASVCTCDYVAQAADESLRDTELCKWREQDRTLRYERLPRRAARLGRLAQLGRRRGLLPRAGRRRPRPERLSVPSAARASRVPPHWVLIAI